MPNPTNPTQKATAPLAKKAALADAGVSVETGIANQYWTELVAYPAGSAASLWLNIDGKGWKRHDDPEASTMLMVQNAFDHPTRSNHEVKVWFQGEVIVGLVVISKAP